MNRKDKIVSAVGATLAAGGIGGGVAVADARPRRLRLRARPRHARSFNDFTASAGHDDGHNVVLNDWFGDNGAAMTWRPWAHTGRF